MGMNGGRGLGKSVLLAYHPDDDDDDGCMSIIVLKGELNVTYPYTNM